MNPFALALLLAKNKMINGAHFVTRAIVRSRWVPLSGWSSWRSSRGCGGGGGRPPGRRRRRRRTVPPSPPRNAGSPLKMRGIGCMTWIRKIDNILTSDANTNAENNQSKDEEDDRPVFERNKVMIDKLPRKRREKFEPGPGKLRSHTGHFSAVRTPETKIWQHDRIKRGSLCWGCWGRKTNVH